MSKQKAMVPYSLNNQDDQLRESENQNYASGLNGSSEQ